MHDFVLEPIPQTFAAFVIYALYRIAHADVVLLEGPQFVADLKTPAVYHGLLEQVTQAPATIEELAQFAVTNIGQLNGHVALHGFAFS
jgi:hypothetical protein